MKSIILLVYDPILYDFQTAIIALPMIIKYYKDKGYEFRVITEDTPECVFPIH